MYFILMHSSANCHDAFISVGQSEDIISVSIPSTKRIYFDLIICRCLTCHADCLACFGGAQDQCLSCTNDSYFLNNSCVERCPFQMFSDKTGRCDFCSLACEGCEGDATNCTACKGDDDRNFYHIARAKILNIYLHRKKKSTHPKHIIEIIT